jgi:hypothetical protein
MIARILLVALCGLIAVGGVGAALADDGDESLGSFEAIDVRKDDSGTDTELVDDDEDGDGDGDGDKTAGDDGTGQGHNHDADATGGDDGTGGGDNSEDVAPAPAPAESPAPAPVYDDYSDDGVAYSAS